MYYEINVTKRGQHFFATAPRSITSATKLREVHDEMIARFPKKDGFGVSVTRYETIGQIVDPCRKDKTE